MRTLTIAAFICLFTGTAFAQEATCAAQVADKKLSGAAKTSFLKKCKQDACTPKAVDKDGKPLKGAAKNSFLTKCEKDA